MRVAFQGYHGAFSESMALRLFDGPETISCKTFGEVFALVENGGADEGVIPVENTQTGRIMEPTSLLIDSRLSACREGMLPIVHCLIARPGTGIGDIRRIYAHPEALSQCRGYLSAIDAEPISWWDGAAAAKGVRDDPHAALVGNEDIARIYGLTVLERGVQDSKGNMTRFFAISARPADPTGDDKTTIYFNARHASGALLSVLRPLADAGINLTRLESVPIPERPWEYGFLADFEGHEGDPHVARVLRTFRETTSFCKVLGSYPAFREECP
ncbi:MAG TPA: bifunctional chorismate mutase/prephenate dehydratase [Methanomicrobia archaeon]|nr:bifunctional chorismate mutase/prephenate dehydratase [Methanomicrobia archaeon]